MALVKQFTFIPDTTINPDEVNANFDDIVGYLNTSVATLDAPTFTGIPTLPASDPTSDNHAARKAYVDNMNTYQTNLIKGAIPKFRIGTFTGSTDGSSLVTVTHGLGAAPVAALATVNYNTSAYGGALLHIVVIAATSTTLTFRVFNNGSTFADGAIKFHWLAYSGMGI